MWKELWRDVKYAKKKFFKSHAENGMEHRLWNNFFMSFEWRNLIFSQLELFKEKILNIKGGAWFLRRRLVYKKACSIWRCVSYSFWKGKKSKASIWIIVEDFSGIQHTTLTANFQKSHFNHFVPIRRRENLKKLFFF